MCTAPFKRLGLVWLASPFSLQSAVADLPLTLAFSPPFTRLFCCICCTSCCCNLFVRNTATYLTVYHFHSPPLVQDEGVVRLAAGVHQPPAGLGDRPRGAECQGHGRLAGGQRQDGGRG